MPGSKKGRLSGGARKAINDQRATDAVNGRMEGITFGRVTKMLGANHVTVAIQHKHGIKELRARIPNIFTRRGATPITTRDVVAIETGKGFDPNVNIKTSDLFDIKVILTSKQANKLHNNGEIPSWMIDVTGDAATATATDEVGGYDFDYSGVKEGDEEDEESEDEAGKMGFSRKASRSAAAAVDSDEDVDIDGI